MGDWPRPCLDEAAFVSGEAGDATPSNDPKDCVPLDLSTSLNNFSSVWGRGGGGGTCARPKQCWRCFVVCCLPSGSAMFSSAVVDRLCDLCDMLVEHRPVGAAATQCVGYMPTTVLGMVPAENRARMCAVECELLRCCGGPTVRRGVAAGGQAGWATPSKALGTRTCLKPRRRLRCGRNAAYALNYGICFFFMISHVPLISGLNNVELVGFV